MRLISSWFSLFIPVIFLVSCQFSPYPQDFDNQAPSETVRDIGGNPSQGSRDIYLAADLKDLCVDHEICLPSYELLPDNFIRAENQEPLDPTICNFDYDPNVISTFVLNRNATSIKGLQLLLSKEDLFFLAWGAIRHQINPYFLLGVLSQESAGNCAAVSGSSAEGCFQITNTFGQAQLDDSYPDRVSGWHWTSRSGSYYPDDIFIDPETYFGETPSSDQYRITLDPTSEIINGTEVSSVANFHFGLIASSLYFKWQQYLLYSSYEDFRDLVSTLFQTEDQKTLWQAAAYNGGAYGAALALEDAGEDFLEERSEETQDYSKAVVDYCKAYEEGELTYSASYTFSDLEWVIDLLAMTYPENWNLDWDSVKDDVRQVFFDDGTTELTFVDDIKAIVYVISTHLPEIAPEWPDEDSI